MLHFQPVESHIQDKDSCRHKREDRLYNEFYDIRILFLFFSI